MIPIKLTITGFLSYRDTVELDFESFKLACISGPNGAGKSSLLDAFTWALFGQARKHDDTVINLQSNEAVVALEFQYEGNIYRVQRSLKKGKTTTLEFQIRGADEGKWKALTGHTLRETQEYIKDTLRLDYETFVNASFFLQGKADQFTQQRAGDRKRILGSILGLDIWDVYRDRVNERRRKAEFEIQGLDGQLAEINAELGQEDASTQQLADLQAELKRLVKMRKTQEQHLENARKEETSLAEKRKMVDMLGQNLQSGQIRQTGLEERLAARIQEREAYAQKVAQADQIEAAYANWQALRVELEHWDDVAQRFREHDTRRQAPRMEIEAERARLTQELENLRGEEKSIQSQASNRQELEAEVNNTLKALEAVEGALMRRSELDEQLQGARTRQAEAKAENPRLKSEMEQLRDRIDQLSQTEGAACPLCGRPLETHDRLQLIEEIKQQGTELGDRYRANQAYLKEADQRVLELETEIASLAKSDNERLTHTQTLSRLKTQIESIQQKAVEWDTRDAPRMAEVQGILASESFSSDARQLLAQIDLELKAIGYDAAAHDACRRQEAISRAAESEFRELASARSALQPLQREIEEAQDQLKLVNSEVAQQQQGYDDAVAHLAAAQAAAPDPEEAERSLNEILEQEKTMEREVGRAQQIVDHIANSKKQLKVITEQREELAKKVSLLKKLDVAFGKDGVPTLLIEQALPEIETRANDLLDRLTEGNMSVRFETQEAFKNKKRADLKDTLNILISDGVGIRDYELYSGGEAFRVNFAIRLALSELLAKRAGARLQTLVIDEGFGSQDAQGRQHLIEAINKVKEDFEKVLVISHIDELKEAFPNRIEVEKTERGSTLRVV